VAEPGTEPDDSDEDFSFGLERILDGIEHHVGRVESGGGAPVMEPLPPSLELPRDPKVREAAKARREAEKALREAQKREREAVKHALEREKHAREKAERAKKE
jgi:hypothetical protein